MNTIKILRNTLLYFFIPGTLLFVIAAFTATAIPLALTLNPLLGLIGIGAAVCLALLAIYTVAMVIFTSIEKAKQKQNAQQVRVAIAEGNPQQNFDTNNNCYCYSMEQEGNDFEVFRRPNQQLDHSAYFFVVRNNFLCKEHKMLYFDSVKQTYEEIYIANKRSFIEMRNELLKDQDNPQAYTDMQFNDDERTYKKSIQQLSPEQLGKVNLFANSSRCYCYFINTKKDFTKFKKRNPNLEHSAYFFVGTTEKKQGQLFYFNAKENKYKEIAIPDKYKFIEMKKTLLAEKRRITWNGDNEITEQENALEPVNIGENTTCQRSQRPLSPCRLESVTTTTKHFHGSENYEHHLPLADKIKFFLARYFSLQAIIKFVCDLLITIILFPFVLLINAITLIINTVILIRNERKENNSDKQNLLSLYPLWTDINYSILIELAVMQTLIPTKANIDTQTTFIQKFYLNSNSPLKTKYSVTTDSGHELDTIEYAKSSNFYEQPISEQKYIIFFHGNCELAEQWKDPETNARLRVHRNDQYAAIRFNYAGVGASTGRLKTKHDLQECGLAQYYRLRDKGVPASNIVLYGFSIGGVASLCSAEFLNKHGENPRIHNVHSLSSLYDIAISFIGLKSKFLIAIIKCSLIIPLLIKAYLWINQWDIDPAKIYNDLPVAPKTHSYLEEDGLMIEAHLGDAVKKQDKKNYLEVRKITRLIKQKFEDNKNKILDAYKACISAGVEGIDAIKIRFTNFINLEIRNEELDINKIAAKIANVKNILDVNPNLAGHNKERLKKLIIRRLRKLQARAISIMNKFNRYLLINGSEELKLRIVETATNIHQKLVEVKDSIISLNDKILSKSAQSYNKSVEEYSIKLNEISGIQQLPQNQNNDTVGVNNTQELTQTLGNLELQQQQLANDYQKDLAILKQLKQKIDPLKNQRMFNYKGFCSHPHISQNEHSIFTDVCSRNGEEVQEENRLHKEYRNHFFKRGPQPAHTEIEATGIREELTKQNEPEQQEV